jgi:transcriptional regulator with XRE-family HTH domain
MPMTVVWRNPVPSERTASFWSIEIKRLRLAQNLSQRRLARLAGVDRASLVRFELGRSRGNLELVEKLVAVLGYELDMVWTPFDPSSAYTALPRPDRDLEPAGRSPRLTDDRDLR